MKYKKKILLRIQSWLLVIMLAFSSAGCSSSTDKNQKDATGKVTTEDAYKPQEDTSKGVVEDSTDKSAETDSGVNPEVLKDIALADIPEYSGDAYVSINNGIPFFTEDEVAKAANSFEEYGELDTYGRCTSCIASVGQDIMPTEKRGSIGQVKPTGWHTVKYDCVDGKYLYNRCHLIGYQLTAENANEQNLITGTRYLNIEGMLPFENMVADYVKETDNHVLYRVTPMYEGNDLVAKGVLMEGMSVEDEGADIQFCVFAYNAQPGVTIDYETGESVLGDDVIQDTSSVQESDETEQEQIADYVLNTNKSSMKFHKPSCSAVEKISSKNRKDVNESRQTLIDQGYSPCGICKP